MRTDMFLRLDDIKGESIDSVHKDEIEILAWNWSMLQPGSSHSGPGSGRCVWNAALWPFIQDA